MLKRENLQIVVRHASRGLETGTYGALRLMLVVLDQPAR